MRHRAAMEPVIGHVKAEHRMGRNYLKGRDGDRANVVLAAAGYNFSLLLQWFRRLLCALLLALLARIQSRDALDEYSRYSSRAKLSRAPLCPRSREGNM